MRVRSVSGEVLENCASRPIDANPRASETHNVVGSGSDLLEQAELLALHLLCAESLLASAAERTERPDSLWITVPSIPHARAAGPPTGRSLF